MELKASELRIGNYVKHKSQIRKIIELNLRYCKTDLINNVNYNSDSLSQYLDLQPIPPTEEWLLKFQCNKFYIKDRLEVEIQGELFEFFVNDIDNTFHIEFTGGEGVSFSKPIKYVHQLQNLYFALTNKELEIKM